MQRVKMVLEESPIPEKHGYRDSAYHWLLDRIERQEASPKERKEIRDLFAKAEREGDLQAREKVRGRYERIFANV